MERLHLQQEYKTVGHSDEKLSTNFKFRSRRRTNITILSGGCLIVFIWLSCSDLDAVNALSQEVHVPILKPVVYVDLSRWENRSTHPRFFLYRDHFRRHFNANSNEDTTVPSSIAQQAQKQRNDGASAIISEREGDRSSLKTAMLYNEPQEEYDDEEDILSLEKLLSERNGIVPKSTSPSNALKSPKIVSKAGESSSGNPLKKPIIFPKDPTNPCNRLQISPEEEGQIQNATNNSSEAQKSQGSEEDSLEIGNRQNFFTRETASSSSEEVEVENKENEQNLKLIRDAVPTFDLTMNIVKLSKWKDQNVVFSPLSVATVLSMLMLGAEGRTFDELARLLERDNISTVSSQSIIRYHSSYQKLLKYLRTSSGEKVMLSIASEMFLDKSYPVKEKFQRDLLYFYEAPIDSFDFSTNGNSFKDRINDWAKEKTHGQIKTVLDEPPSSSTVMGIINAIYFKGSWEIPFSEKLTRWRGFQVDAKEKIQVQMMVNILEVPYVDREAFEMIALPYKENRTGLFVILPKGNDGIGSLRHVENVLTTEYLKESIRSMNYSKVALSLPKLKYSADGSMEDILQSMNLSTVFSPAHANFSGVSSNDLSISSLIHRAVVEINEKGIIAAAVSLASSDRVLADLPISFKCDKPFLFFIYHVKADTILFWGRVIRPSYPSNSTNR